MKTTVLAALILASVAINANAQYQNASARGGYDYARVISAQPIYETVQVEEGREVCRNERVQYVERNGRRSETSGVVGAILGGVIGNQFGSGRGRTAATIAGVALGSAIANDADRNSRQRTRYGTERVCSYEPRHRNERELVGYNVRYDYKGQIGETVTRNQPGNTIRVQVDVTPIED